MHAGNLRSSGFLRKPRRSSGLGNLKLEAVGRKELLDPMKKEQMNKTKMISFFLLYAAAILFSQPTDGTEGRGSAARDAKANSRGNFAREQLDPKDRERLFAAVAAGDKPTTAALLEKTKDVDLCNTSGYTLLHWAVLTKQKEIASLLISRGAGVQAVLPNGSTALHTAVFTGNRDLVQLLIDHGAQVYAVDQLEKRPIDLALELGHKDLPEPPGKGLPGIGQP